jgi:hypothetical protein
VSRYIRADIVLGDSEDTKVTPADVFDAVVAFLDSKGVDRDHRFVEAFTSPEPVPAALAVQLAGDNPKGASRGRKG